MKYFSRKLESSLMDSNSAYKAEKIASAANPLDSEFRRPILSALPDRLAKPVSERYVDIYQTKGRRDANLYMLDIKDDLTSCALSLSASDDELVSFAKSAARDCFDYRRRYGNNSKAALKFLIGYISRHYKIDLPLPFQALLEENAVTLSSNSIGYRNVTNRTPDTDTVTVPVAVTVTEKKPQRNVTLTIEGVLNRICDEQWWRRTLRNVTSRNVEKHSIDLGLVHREAGIYVSDESMQRKRQQKRRNRIAMEKSLVVNEQGQEYTLQELIDRSLANPANRRYELMVRIRGTEEISKSLGHSAVMLTVTAPSSMHPRKFEDGQPNRKYDGTSPLEAHKYLTNLWAQIRAKLAREKLLYYGFRVVEPHHDGTPHWHILLFMPKENINPVSSIVRDYSLKLYPNERGAKKYRFDKVIVDPKKGSATGYIAKYISKNIDGHGIDDDLYGHDAKDSSQRISAWASIWGVRQFQQLGGPPVTLYRELRRIQGNELNGLLLETWEACNSKNWSKFIQLMGGPTIKRKECPFKVARTWDIEPNRYLEQKGYKIIGVSYNNVTVPTRIHQWTVKRQPEFIQRVYINNDSNSFVGPALPPLGWHERNFEKMRA